MWVWGGVLPCQIFYTCRLTGKAKETRLNFSDLSRFQRCFSCWCTEGIFSDPGSWTFLKRRTCPELTDLDLKNHLLVNVQVSQRGRATSMFVLIDLELWEYIACKSVKLGLFLKTSGLLFFGEKKNCRSARSAKSLQMKIHGKKPLLFLCVFCMQRREMICMLVQAKIVSSNQTFMI